MGQSETIIEGLFSVETELLTGEEHFVIFPSKPTEYRSLNKLSMTKKEWLEELGKQLWSVDKETDAAYEELSDLFRPYNDKKIRIRIEEIG